MDAQNSGLKRALRPWNSISATIGGAVLALTVLAGSSVWLAVANMAEREFAQEHARQARTVSGIIARDLAEHMLAGGGQSIWHEIGIEARHYVEMSGAARVLVINAAGAVKAASDDTAGTQIQTRANPECPGCDWAESFPATSTLLARDGSARLRVVNPIPNSRACLGCHASLDTSRGFIAVDFDLAPLKSASEARNRVILALGIGASILLVALLAILLRRLVIRPVASLEGSMDRIAAGDLSVRASVPVQNEIAALASHFNHMALRIEAARTESTLLYKLVVEASKKLEMTDFTKNVSQVIHDNLRPRHSAFVLENSSGGWICAMTSDNGEPAVASGEDTLDTALAAGSAVMGPFATTAACELVPNAHATQKLQKATGQNGLSFALPVVADARLIGMLICLDIPDRIPIGKDLLQNLGVHLMLAANNSRHYTGAITDGLTRLNNKHYGLVRLEEAVFAAKRYNAGLVLAMCDIDHFKRVNDTLGHLAGDTVLKEVARRIKACVRKSDTAIRYGGEEFMIIIPQVGSDSLAMIGEKVRHAVSSVSIAPGGTHDPIDVTVSIGIAAYNAHTETGQALIGRADAALYRAKERGRDRVEVDY